MDLAELSQDADFRDLLRRAAEQHAADRAGHPGVRPDGVAIARDHAAPALAAGVDPASSRADPVVEAALARYADLVGQPDRPDLRRRLLSRVDTASDPRRERYLELLAVINGWPPAESARPALAWFSRALRIRTPA